MGTVISLVAISAFIGLGFYLGGIIADVIVDGVKAQYSKLTAKAGK